MVGMVVIQRKEERHVMMPRCFPHRYNAILDEDFNLKRARKPLQIRKKTQSKD